MAPGEGRRVYDTVVGELEIYTHPCVYEPAEDSLLAIKAVKQLADEGYQPGIILELGIGTGIISVAASRLFPQAFLIGVDVNEYAFKTARRNLEGSNSTVIACNWSSCIRGPVDLSIVNPPYLPVSDELGECSLLSKAWSGSPGLLEDICSELASISNAIVLVYSSLSGWSPRECLARRGFRVIHLLEESYFMEKLYAVVAVRGKDWISSD